MGERIRRAGFPVTSTKKVAQAPTYPTYPKSPSAGANMGSPAVRSPTPMAALDSSQLLFPPWILLYNILLETIH